MNHLKHPIYSIAVFIILVELIYTTKSFGQDTFSICAVDPVTGQVGSAGATCITSSAVSALIISDVHPGKGVIHTQASWMAANQNYGRSLMSMNLLPQQIIDSLVTNDAGSNSSIRQYGVVTLDSGGMSAAHTGLSCMNYKNHITGPGYSIQGNILLGPQILDSMEARFLNTTGDLACKLMAALQGAKVIGADTRCNPYGISSYSAFIRMAQTGDSVSNLSLDLSVNTYPGNKDPIDSLQVLFNQSAGCSTNDVSFVTSRHTINVGPNPVADFIYLESYSGFWHVEIVSITGSKLYSEPLNSSSSTSIDFRAFDRGIYFLLLHSLDGQRMSKKIVKN
jgi:uncharacterized Ntn-hydrolase superfamily protein